MGVFIALLASPLVVTGGDQTDFICNTTHPVTTRDYIQCQDTTYHQFFYYLLAQAILATVILPVTFS